MKCARSVVRGCIIIHLRLLHEMNTSCEIWNRIVKQHPFKIQKIFSMNNSIANTTLNSFETYVIDQNNKMKFMKRIILKNYYILKELFFSKK